jgi:hypothetical protein
MVRFVFVTNAEVASGIFDCQSFLPVSMSKNTTSSQTPSVGDPLGLGGWTTTAVRPSAVTCLVVAQMWPPSLRVHALSPPYRSTLKPMISSAMPLAKILPVAQVPGA